MIFYNFFNLLFKFMEILIIIEAVLSWFMMGKENEFTIAIHKINAPLLEPGRRLQEKFFPQLMIDFSPVIALVIISILRRIIL